MSPAVQSNGENGMVPDIDILASEDLQKLGYKQEMTRVRKLLIGAIACVNSYL
jgi:hypothetical protein